MSIMFVNPAGHRKRASKKKRKLTHILRRNPMAGKSKKKGKKSPAKKPKKKTAARKSPTKKPKKRRPSTKKQLAAARKLLGKHGFRAKLRTKVVAARAGAKVKKKAARDAAKDKKKAAAYRKRSAAAAKARKAAAKAAQRAMDMSAKLIRTNPSRRRKHTGRKHTGRKHTRRSTRRYRRNPAGGDIIKMLMGAVKMAAPAVGAMLIGKALSTQAIKNIPMLSKVMGYEKPILDVAMLVAVHFGAPKVPMLRKYQTSIMVGLGVNLIVDTLSAALPADIKGKIGLSGDGIYDRALSDYVTTSDYLTTGATPIDDDIALAVSFRRWLWSSLWPRLRVLRKGWHCQSKREQAHE